MAKTDTKEPAAGAVEGVVVEQGQSVAEAMSAASSPFDDALGASETPNGDPEAAYQDEYSVPTGLGGLTSTPVFERDEISLPRLRLCHGQTAEVQEGKASIGQWVLGGHDPLDTITFIPLMMGVDYGHRDKDTGVMSPCVNPRCPGREWGENDPRTGKGTPPWCTRVYRYLGYAVEYGVTAEFHLSKSGEKVARELHTIIATKGMGNFAITLGKQTQQGPRGPYPLAAIRLTQVPATELNAARMLVSGQ